MFKVLAVALNAGISTQLTTNGTRLTHGHITMLNDLNIALSVSLNGVSEGEKSLCELITVNPDIVKILKRSKKLQIRKVLMPGESFLMGALALVTTFNNAKIEITLDHTSLDKFTLTDLALLSLDFSRLGEAFSKHGDWLEFVNFVPAICDCADNITMNPDGSCISFAERFGVASKGIGCSYVRQNMKPGLYEAYFKVINAAMEHTK